MAHVPQGSIDSLITVHHNSIYNTTNYQHFFYWVESLP